MNTYSYRIYVHFRNSMFDLSYLKSYRTKKLAMSYATKVFSQDNIIRVVVQKWTSGFGHYVETVYSCI